MALVSTTVALPYGPAVDFTDFITEKLSVSAGTCVGAVLYHVAGATIYATTISVSAGNWRIHDKRYSLLILPSQNSVDNCFLYAAISATSVLPTDTAAIEIADPLPASVATKQADIILRRESSAARASDNGDTYTKFSLLGASRKVMNNYSIE